MSQEQNEKYGKQCILGPGYDLDNDGIEEEEGKADARGQAQAPHQPEVQKHGALPPEPAPVEAPAEEPAPGPAEEPM